jgi:hypothetical protein
MIYIPDPVFSGDQTEEMGGTSTPKGERRGAYRVSLRKPEGKRLLGIHKCRWEDSIKMYLQ